MAKVGLYLMFRIYLFSVNNVFASVFAFMMTNVKVSYLIGFFKGQTSKPNDPNIDESDDEWATDDECGIDAQVGFFIASINLFSSLFWSRFWFENMYIYDLISFLVTKVKATSFNKQTTISKNNRD